MLGSSERETWRLAQTGFIARYAFEGEAMITRRSLFLGLALAFAGIARSLGLTTQPEPALARRKKKHHKGGNGGGGYY
jgi:hypothetical protein